MSVRTRSLNPAAVVFGAMALAATASTAWTQDATFSDGSQCGLEELGIRMERVSYVPYRTANSSNLRASCTSGNNCWIHMRGWLYYQDPVLHGAVKSKKTLIYNHGHNQERTEPCAVVKYFVGEGWVVFAPLRRGHSSATPNPIPANWEYINSTGVYIDDWVANCGHRDPVSGSCGKTDEELQGQYMHRQVNEVEDQLAFVRELPAIGGTGRLADRTQISLLGHSFGGILTVLANAEVEHPYHNVAIDVSGAVLDWSVFWRDELEAAQLRAQRPTYFLQPKNEFTLRPTQHLGSVAMRDSERQRSQAAIFPPTPFDPDNEDPEGLQAHEDFIGTLSQLKIWGPSAVEFSKRYPR
jgi:hypothetical protein